MSALLAVVVDGVIYASWLFMIAVGLTLIYGVMKILNIAHGSLYALGAYGAASLAGYWLSQGYAPFGSYAALLAAAALVGGGAMVLAGWLASRIALGGGVGGAGVVLARLVLGVAAKWLVLAVTLLLGMAALRLPPLPMLAAAAAALAAQMLALALDRRNGQSA